MNKNFLFYVLIVFSIYLLPMLVSCNKNMNTTISSPNGKVVVELSISTDSQLVYQVKMDSQIVLEPSALGVIREDGDYSKNLKWIGVSENKTIEDNYTMIVHKKEKYNYKANEQVVTVESAKGQQMQVIIRVSDNGVAFRYYFPGTSEDIKKISSEETTFNFPSEAKAWLQPCADAKTFWAKANPSYEEFYEQSIPVGKPSPLKAGWVFPALFKSGDNWVLISETGLDRNYCASRLRAESPEGAYKIGFPQDKEVVFTGELNPQSKLPWYSPWRIIAIGELKDIVESSLGTDLANPAIKGDFSWVKHGRASWSWVLLKDSFTIYPVQKEFINYASDMGWEYCLIDAFWDELIGYDKIKELAKYAATKNVKIILWYNSSGDWNETPLTPKGALLTSEARIKEFTKIKEMGIAGVKVDFFGGDGQSVVNHYIDVLEDAAKVGIMVNFHGCTLPRGWQRTYPHLLSMESIKGMEYVTFDQANANAQPNHCAMIPFTRNVFDPMDFTPTCFGEINKIKRVTSNGFELALPVLFQSGIQHFAETAEGMTKVPVYVKQFLKDVPVVWDETRFIDGFPGEYVVMARRSGTKWYIAGINGKNETRSINIDISFTNKGKGSLITDGENNRSFKQSEIILNQGEKLSLELMPNGGFVLLFE